jgi:cell division septum initiation protein DivIVA
MKSQQVDEALDQMQNAMQKLYKVVDKLEQRIATLERVLQSHAKCIGEMRDKDDLKDMPEEVLVKTWEEKNE